MTGGERREDGEGEAWAVVEESAGRGDWLRGAAASLPVSGSSEDASLIAFTGTLH